MLRAGESAFAWRERARRHHRAGTTFTVRLSRAARVTITFERAVTHRCGHRRCTRMVRVGAVTFTGHAGVNRVRFTGVIGRRRLAPGRYAAVIVARGGGQTARTHPLRFRILRSARRG